MIYTIYRGGILIVTYDSDESMDIPYKQNAFTTHYNTILIL